MKKVLLPTDFSEYARNAAEYALGMFSDEKTEFILLNVWAEPRQSATISLSPLLDILEKDSLSGLENEMEHLKTKFTGSNLSISDSSVYGNFNSIVEQMVVQDAVDLVVMGTKGSSGIAKILMGSNTADIVENVKCPVLAIPKEAKFEAPRHIAFATDHKKFKNSDVITTLTEIATRYDSEILVVHIDKDPDDDLPNMSSEEYIHSILDKVPHKIYNINTNNIADGLNSFVESHDIDMLVVVAHEYNYLKRFFRSSESKNIAMMSKVPLLVLHD